MNIVIWAAVYRLIKLTMTHLPLSPSSLGKLGLSTAAARRADVAHEAVRDGAGLHLEHLAP